MNRQRQKVRGKEREKERKLRQRKKGEKKRKKSNKDGYYREKRIQKGERKRIHLMQKINKNRKK